MVCLKKRADENLAIVDAGQNLMPGIDWYRYPIVQVKPNIVSQISKNYTVHGCLCDSMDILGQNVEFEDLQIGEVLAIKCVGGYDMARSFVWQLPKAPVVWVDEESNVSISRPSEFN